jgi:hypothetical protein
MELGLPATPPQGEMLTIKQIEAALGVATSNTHPSQHRRRTAHPEGLGIRLTDDLRACARDGFRLHLSRATPSAACTHWKAPPFHGAHPIQSLGDSTGAQAE